MLDIADELHRWVEQGRDFAVATVVATHGSAPRQPGAALAVDGAGTAIGSVSGGCVEGAVYELCQEALRTGRPVLERFGYSDEDAFAVGLTCGGIIDILVEPIRAVPSPAAHPAGDGTAAGSRRTAPPARSPPGWPPPPRGAGGPRPGRPGSRRIPRPCPARPARRQPHRHPRRPPRPGPHRARRGPCPAGRRAHHDGRPRYGGRRRTGGRRGAAGGLALRRDDRAARGVLRPGPRLIVFGAIDFAAALVKVGKFLNYHVTVCDARPVFATRSRFPDADEIVVDWPHRYLDSQELDARTVLCVLTHDAKFDVPLLERALRLPVAYVGAMGSRRTHLDRQRRLREVGLSELELNRLRSPIGLDLGARTPEETALSIAAEIVANRRGGTGTPLTGAHTPIHHDTARRVGRIGSVA